MITNIWLRFKDNIPDSISILIKKIYINMFILFFPYGVFKKIDYENESFHIKVDPRNGTVDNIILFEGVFDRDHLTLIKQKLKEGETFLDIGANIGQYSLFSSKVVGENGRVFAFEPVKDIYDQFNESIKKNNIKNIFLYNKACGEKQDILYINKFQGHAGGSSFISSENSKNVKKEEVEIIVLDDFLGDKKIDFIKIDVEGYEYEVLCGLKRIISKYKPKILLEYSPDMYIRNIKENTHLILEYLFSSQYKIKDISNNKDVLNIDYPYRNNISMCYLYCE